MAKLSRAFIIMAALPFFVQCGRKAEEKPKPAPAVIETVKFDHPAAYRDLSLKLSLSALALLDCHKQSHALNREIRRPTQSRSLQQTSAAFQVEVEKLRSEKANIRVFSEQIRNFPPPPPEWQEAKNLLIEMLVSLEDISQTMVEDTDPEGRTIVFLHATEDQLNATGAPFVRAYKRLDLMIPH